MNKKSAIIVILIVLLAIGYASLYVILRPMLLRDEVGVKGPISIDFKRVMDPDDVLSRLTITPAIEGTWKMTGTIAEFIPTFSFTDNTTYQLILAASAKQFIGFPLPYQRQWEIKVRPLEVLVIQKPNDGPELWIYSMDGVESRQVTETGGQVIDYSASLNGEMIAYAAYNSQGGSDIFWQTRAQTNSPYMVTCGADICSQPTWSADGQWVAFTRVSHGISRIWTARISDGSTAPLSENYQGQLPNWSPDGRHLAFFNPEQNEIDIINTETLAWQVVSTTIPQKPIWSSDGSQLLILRNFVGEGQPYTKVVRVNLASNEVGFVLGEDFNSMDYGTPAWRPTEDWVAVSRRLIANTITKQIYVVHLDGSEEIVLTDAPSYTHASLSWDPTGKWILYQRFAVGVGGAQPEVEVRSFPSGEVIFHIEDAALPQWLP